MLTRFTRSVAGTALAAGTLGLVALISAGTAAAGSADTAFIDQLEQHGVQAPSTQDAISLAHGVCNALDQGASSREVISAVGNKTGLNAKASKIFAVDAAQTYCPQYVSAS